MIYLWIAYANIQILREVMRLTPFTGDLGTLVALANHEFCTLIISVPFSHLEYAFSRSLHIFTRIRVAKPGLTRYIKETCLYEEPIM
jgi:hypothetical protein